ncbi:MAG: hypothetical protein AAGA48_00850 [Myxococcota bacterium]
MLNLCDASPEAWVQFVQRMVSEGARVRKPVLALGEPAEAVTSVRQQGTVVPQGAAPGRYDARALPPESPWPS